MAIPDHNLACPGMHNMRDVSASHGKIENAPEGAGNTDGGLPNPKQPERTTPMVDQNVPQFPKRWNIVAPFEGMTIGDLRLIVRLTADKPDDEPLAYSFDSDLDQLTGIQVV